MSNDEDRLARAVIDDAFTAMLAESRADVAVRAPEGTYGLPGVARHGRTTTPVTGPGPFW